MAYHESGHTIAGYFLPNADLVHKVTIVPRGQAGGYMVPIPKEERFILTEPELKDRIAGLLAGRVAEEIVFGEVSVGASDDFRKATRIARRMVTEFGMSRLGPLQFGENQGQVFLGRDIGHERNYSEQIAYEIDQEVRRIITEQYERCKELLTKHRDKLELVAETLLEVETLTADQIKEVIETGELSNHPLKGGKDKQGEAGPNQGATEAKDDVKVHIQSKKGEEYRPQDRRQTDGAEEKHIEEKQGDKDNKED
ncbi:peptidase M41 [Caldalkalibacillus thermarum TA2.A1]|uniref:Peptidase M41 n=1 Tax=Caldalkalibacillus thermarum (strain TA2.A1) TaxID=986075 RepID=F5LA11_CALTT|nr:peptidase M41 [Caldalkalibacillus thermarum TA2.A1]